MKRKKIGYVLLVTGLLVFFINLLAMRMSWYWIMWWFDMPMHFLGGFFSGLLTLFFLYPRIRALHRDGKNGRAFLLIMAGVLAIGILWELFEFGVETIIPTLDIANIHDSLSDLCFDLAGGVFLFMKTGMIRHPEALSNDTI